MAGESALKRRIDSTSGRPRNEERRLIEAAQRDTRRFAEIYENNFERVYAFIAWRVSDRDQAQDLTADVFHNAAQESPPLRVPRRAVRDVAVSHRRTPRSHGPHR